MLTSVTSQFSNFWEPNQTINFANKTPKLNKQVAICDFDNIHSNQFPKITKLQKLS